MKVRLCIPFSANPYRDFFGAVNGHVYEVSMVDTSFDGKEYMTEEKLNDGYPTFLPIEWCVPVEELPEELFTI